MRVILTEDVRGTGKKGDVIDVRDGYGRNFLIPRHLALQATGGNLKSFDNVVKNLINKKERTTKTAADVKARLEEATLSVKKKVGIDGRLFGSVTPKDVADAIKDAVGVEIDKRTVRIDEHIKMTGAYTVEIHLQKDINATVKLEVEKET